jgi:hypothetical protein
MGERIRYCPVDGRVTEADYKQWLDWIGFNTEHCHQCFLWYHRMGQFVAKRLGES